MAALQPGTFVQGPSPEQASTSTPASQTERLARRGRRALLYTGAVVFVALLAVLIVLSSKNTRSVTLDRAVGSTNASLVWIVLAAAVVGWLIGIATAVALRHRTRRV